MPLMLSLEYTYMIIFPGMVTLTFFFITTESTTILYYLLVFAVVFHIWQRYVMLWGYGRTSVDSAETFLSFLRMWGLNLSVFPAAIVYWLWRLDVLNDSLGIVIGILVWALAFLLYQFG